MGASMGKSKSKQKSSSSSTSESSVWEQQAPFLQGLYERGSALMDQQMSGGGAGGEEYRSPAFSAWSRLIGGGENPFLGKQISDAQDYAAKGFSRNILPALNASAISSGNLGGARGSIAAGMAGEEATRQQGEIASNMSGAAYESDMNRIIQALNMTGGLSGLGASSWAPLMQYANLLGRPTLESTGMSTSKGSGSGNSFNIGISGTGQT